MTAVSVGGTTRRRGFLKGACAAAACGLSAGARGATGGNAAPDLVIGLLSDVHVRVGPRDDPKRATALFRHALEYFRDRHVDGVLVSGDLADNGLETELKALADAWFAVFPDGRLPDGSPVANLMHYGDHDAEARFYDDRLKARFREAGVPTPRSLSAGKLRRECWEAFFHEPWTPVRHVRVKGYDFVLSNFMREYGSAPDDLAARLAALDLPRDRPFFYSQHRYIGGTYLADEEMWGTDRGVAEKALAHWPNAIAFQGHTHYMLTDPRGVWIGGYVAVNNGSLANAPVGRVRENGVDISWYKDDYMREKQMPHVLGGKGHGGSVMTVRGDSVVIERRDFGFDQPLGPDIAFSMDARARPSQVDAARRAASSAPAFPAGARVEVSEGVGRDRRGRATWQVTVRFPTAPAQGGRPRAHEYFVRVERADGTLLKGKRVYSPGINLPESRDAAWATCVFAASEVACEGALRVLVRPANCWGVCGRALVGAYAGAGAPARRG